VALRVCALLQRRPSVADGLNRDGLHVQQRGVLRRRVLHEGQVEQAGANGARAYDKRIEGRKRRKVTVPKESTARYPARSYRP
jgi:hypothetical protein